MTDPPILTPLTAIEKAELLNALPLTTAGRTMLRRLLAETDALRAQVERLEKEVAELEEYCDHEGL
ncbi:MAG: hypothetical protein OEW98_00130 [Betaproteobacteria bacterium]|nr:hypothetical protein [Betaproteobacteria bacterium]